VDELPAVASVGDDPADRRMDLHQGDARLDHGDGGLLGAEDDLVDFLLFAGELPRRTTLRGTGGSPPY
jgi:hypothetical protein